MHTWDMAAPSRAWKKVTGSPAGSALALGAAVGIPTYFAAPWLLRKGYEMAKPMLPASTQQKMEEEMATKMPAIQWKTTAAAGGLMAALSLAHNWDSKYPGKSLIKWNYADGPKTTNG